MGITYSGHIAYSYALFDVLGRLRSYLVNLSSSHIVVLGLHHIDTSRCAKICRVCNHKLVQEYVREVQQRVVSCVSNTALVNAHSITEKSLHSHDGVHPSNTVSRKLWYLILQALCSVGEGCGIFNTGMPCSTLTPTFDHRRIIEARNEVEGIFMKTSLKERDRHNFSCFQLKNDSLFWDSRFYI